MHHPGRRLSIYVRGILCACSWGPLPHVRFFPLLAYSKLGTVQLYIVLLIERTLHTWLFHRIFFAPFPYFLRWLKCLNHNIWLCVDNRNLQGFRHKLNMELDLKSLFRLHVHSCIHWLRPRNLSPPPALGLIYEGAIGQLR